MNNPLLLKVIGDAPSNITYLAIGSANNAEQQFPNFLLNMILYDNSFFKKTTIILIDPYHENPPKFFKEYNISDLQVEIKNITSEIKLYKFKFNDNSVETIIIKSYFDYNQDYKFVQELAKIVCSNHTNLLLGYDYSGNRLYSLNKKLYNEANAIDKSKLKKQVLLDYTYDKDLGCFPEKSNCFPLISIVQNRYFEFINLTLDTLQNNIKVYKNLKDSDITLLFNFQTLKDHLQEYINNYIYSLKILDAVYFRQLNNYSKDSCEYIINNIPKYKIYIGQNINYLIKYVDSNYSTCDDLELFKNVITEIFINKYLEIINLLISINDNHRKYTYDELFEIFKKNNLYHVQDKFIQIIKSIDF